MEAKEEEALLRVSISTSLGFLNKSNQNLAKLLSRISNDSIII
jgi:hypothetical protein